MLESHLRNLKHGVFSQQGINIAAHPDDFDNKDRALIGEGNF